MANGDRSDVAVPLDQPGCVVGFAEREQSEPECLDHFECLTHSRFSFSVRTKCSAQPLPSGARAKSGELAMPRKRNSPWLASDMYCEPWSWRTLRLRALCSAKSPKCCRTPPYWFECLKAGGLPGGADADALGTEMVD